jgi:hypothetical protein
LIEVQATKKHEIQQKKAPFSVVRINNIYEQVDGRTPKSAANTVLMCYGKEGVACCAASLHQTH